MSEPIKRDQLRMKLVERKKWFERQKKILTTACWTGAILATDQILDDLRRK